MVKIRTNKCFNKGGYVSFVGYDGAFVVSRVLAGCFVLDLLLIYERAPP